MNKIKPFLWFDGKAGEAAEFYVSLFKNSRIQSVSHVGEGGPGEKGTVMTVSFELEGQEFIALNGGPQYAFTPAISFFVNCETQAEIDELWDRLCDGGQPVQCGWLTDKYGLSWQIVPTILLDMLQDDDERRAQNVMEAMLAMVKLDIPTLQRAYDR